MKQTADGSKASRGVNVREGCLAGRALPRIALAATCQAAYGSKSGLPVEEMRRNAARSSSWSFEWRVPGKRKKR
jgi:hypothetical protein